VIRNQAHTAYLKLVAVEQAFRRRGIATKLLDLFEERAVIAGATRVQVRYCSPTYLLPGLDPGYTSALTLLLRRGYQTDKRSICNMDVELHEEQLNTKGDEKRLSDLGYSVRRAVHEDMDEATDLADQLGGEGWRGEIAQGFDFEPIRLHLAESRQGIVAFAVQDVVGPGLFGPTDTDPNHRRLRIGTVLLKRCLRDVLAQGRPHAKICAVGPIPFYAHAVSAKVGRIFWTLEKQL
jgi:mycothiol synthase